MPIFYAPFAHMALPSADPTAKYERVRQLMAYLMNWGNA
ncbi:gp076 [Rhodococcus phage ReqiPoco6]|uniref:Gp076 n=1 Tax=Rhodococcus phage ReqiPoco6 TaxID=691964 RepID=D4P7U4_9CAUD|nr:gp076 [Rhodococcus phage ReqiPoco6]ADD81074.1 gp076 [Rhodococcus phage ReqiPoco6]